MSASSSVVPARWQRVQHALLERGRLLVRDLEGLRERVDRDRRRRAQGAGGWRAGRSACERRGHAARRVAVGAVARPGRSPMSVAFPSASSSPAAPASSAPAVLALAARTPSPRSSRSTTSSAAAPSSTCRGCARPACASSTATCASATTCAALEPRRRARRVLRRAVGARRRATAAPTTSCRPTCVGAHHCLELARRDGAQFDLPLDQPRLSGRGARSAGAATSATTRFELADDAAGPRGVAGGHRRGLPARRRAHALRGHEARRRAARSPSTRDASACAPSIDRCGVIAGPWQMGKVDQGVFTHWMLAHHLGRPLQLHRLRRQGKQVRDLLHVDDLVDLSTTSSSTPTTGTARPSTSAAGARAACRCAETTALCRELTGTRRRPSAPAGEARPGDVPHLHLRLRAPVRAHRLAPAALRAPVLDGHRRLDPRQRARPSVIGARVSPEESVMRSCHRHRLGGLIGSESVRHFVAAGLRRRRASRTTCARSSSAPTASTRRTHASGCSTSSRTPSAAVELDIRDADGVDALFAEPRAATSSSSSTPRRSPRTTGRRRTRTPTSPSTPTAR